MLQADVVVAFPACCKPLAAPRRFAMLLPALHGGRGQAISRSARPPVERWRAATRNGSVMLGLVFRYDYCQTSCPGALVAGRTQKGYEVVYAVMPLRSTVRYLFSLILHYRAATPCGYPATESWPSAGAWSNKFQRRPRHRLRRYRLRTAPAFSSTAVAAISPVTANSVVRIVPDLVTKQGLVPC